MEYVTLCIAVAGLALSIFNSWKAISKDKVKVRVSPVWMTPLSHHPSFVGTRVVNSGHVDVTITNASFMFADHSTAYFPDRAVDNGAPLPRRMEPRTAFTVVFPSATGDDLRLRKATAIFADTACGRRFLGRVHVWPRQRP
jgi:hypothetical protein